MQLLNHRQIRRIATDRLREAFADIPETQRRLTDPVLASTDGNRTTERNRGNLMGEKLMEK